MASFSEVCEQICAKIHNVYKAKNSDYGNAYTGLRKKYKDLILIHLEENGTGSILSPRRKSPVWLSL